MRNALARCFSREWQRLTMDTIASCAFGIDANALTSESSSFLKHVRQFFQALEDALHSGVTQVIQPLACRYLDFHTSAWF